MGAEGRVDSIGCGLARYMVQAEGFPRALPVRRVAVTIVWVACAGVLDDFDDAPEG